MRIRQSIHTTMAAQLWTIKENRLGHAVVLVPNVLSSDGAWLHLPMPLSAANVVPNKLVLDSSLRMRPRCGFVDVPHLARQAFVNAVRGVVTTAA